MWTIDLSKFYLIDKNQIIRNIYIAAIVFGVFTSLFPWFVWPIATTFPIIVAIPVTIALLFSRGLSTPLFNRKDYILPLLSYTVLVFYIAITNVRNLNGILIQVFNCIVLFSLFCCDTSLFKRISTILSKILGGFLVLTIPLFFLYIIGFPLPSTDIQYGDNFYSFSNYYFFLIDDRQLFAIIPRFQSVFLEPSYLGSMCVLLLQTQRGQWRKWYNMSLLAGILLSFSLGAYVYLVAVMFLNAWTDRKEIVKKYLVTISIILMIVGGSFVYNQGDNLIHNLIILRLEINDGKMAGDQRVSEGFEKDYENFWDSTDIFFGKHKENEVGDSGYKVFIYSNGLVGLFLLALFYVLALIKAKNQRAAISAFILALLIFRVDGFVLIYARLIPLYLTAYIDGEETSSEKGEEQL